MTTKLLANQYQSILADPVEGFTVELADESSLYEWRVYIEGPKDTPYEGGVFQLALSFPQDYPMSPPVLKFMSSFWHPNVYNDGKVCMSILHPPGEDVMSGELAQERWLPTQSVTTIVLSLLSLLNDPNCSSPANVDASVEWRKNKESYVTKCKKLVERANKEKPAHIVIPHPDTNEEEHKRAVQKWKEINKNIDEEDFFEHHEDDDDEVESSDGNDDEDLSESNEGDVASGNEEGEEKEKVKQEEKKKNGAEQDKGKAKESEEPKTTLADTSSTSTKSISASSSSALPSNQPLEKQPSFTPPSSSSVIPPSSSSLDAPLSADLAPVAAPSAAPALAASVPAIPVPALPQAPVPAAAPGADRNEISVESAQNNSAIDPNNSPTSPRNQPANSSPSSSPGGKSAKNKKKKKCIIM